MAVYTDVGEEELAKFLAGYDLGALLSCKGIAEGVENTNYLLHTAAGYFILTLYEKRVAKADLPFFIGLMEHLATRGINCPQPVKNKKGSALAELAGRPAAIVTFLEGVSVRRPNVSHCTAVGRALAQLHLAGNDFKLHRKNALALSGWEPLARTADKRADEVAPGLQKIIADEIAYLSAHWPRQLPRGVIHADLFPDNVFFLGDKLSGLIDFYFACDDLLSYDLAICLNAWCFEPDGSYNVTKGRALLVGLFRRARAASRGAGGAAATGARRRAALPVDTARGLARRAGRGAGAAQGSARVSEEAPLPPAHRPRARLWTGRMKGRVVIHTDGACSGNPGPGGWGVVMRFGPELREIQGGEAQTTNNRMELTAAIKALEALERPADGRSLYRLAIS